MSRREKATEITAMERRKKATKITTMTDVAHQAAQVLRDLYTLKVLTPEEVETEFTVNEKNKKVLCVRIVETKENVVICSDIVAGLLDNGVTVFQHGGDTKDGKRLLLCEFYYDE